MNEPKTIIEALRITKDKFSDYASVKVSIESKQHSGDMPETLQWSIYVSGIDHSGEYPTFKQAFNNIEKKQSAAREAIRKVEVENDVSVELTNNQN